MSDHQAAEPRHQQIVELVSRQGFLTLDSLARHFGVTVQTIRRGSAIAVPRRKAG
jgi:DeoR family glycerol-3-phosphate regulon repressor